MMYNGGRDNATSGYFWKGNKIVLRPVHEEDWRTGYEEETDSEGIRLFNAGIHPPVNQEAFMQKMHDAGTNPLFFSIENMDKELVGLARIDAGEGKDGTFSLCVRIYRAYRGRGYATDAMKIMLRYGFLELRCHKFNSETIDLNQASICLHKSLGFVEEGRRRQNVFTGGQFHDEVLFGMTREEYDSMVEAQKL